MDGMLSQDEINALLSGLSDSTEPEETVEDDEMALLNSALYLSDAEKDVIGEVSNICMGSAATALFSILNHRVNITTLWAERQQHYPKTSRYHSFSESSSPRIRGEILPLQTVLFFQVLLLFQNSSYCSLLSIVYRLYGVNFTYYNFTLFF